jgi:hypothetical protein
VGGKEGKEALDIFGRMLMAVRDSAIVQWDQIIEGSRRKYPPWERLEKATPGLTAEHREVLYKALPHIVDTVLYCLLAELDANQQVRVSVETSKGVIDNLPQKSWGFPAEPCGPNGWLERFSTQRFEQPL